MAKDIKPNERIILIYGLTGMQMLGLSSMAEKIGVKCQAVSDTQTSLTVAQLLDGQQLPPQPPRPLVGKFALLHGFDGQEQIAAMLINQVASGVIKAIHTKHNTDWAFSELCTEIHREHQTMKNGSKA